MSVSFSPGAGTGAGAGMVRVNAHGCALRSDSSVLDSYDFPSLRSLVLEGGGVSVRSAGSEELCADPGGGGDSAGAAGGRG